MNRANLVVVSNRGPLSFSRNNAGRLVARQGAGGVVSALTPLLTGSGATWITTAVSDDDRAAAREGLMRSDGIRLVPVTVDPDMYRMSYDVISNATLWFVHHRLFDLARRPRFDRKWREAWNGYREVNRAFADAVVEAAPNGASVLVQDYQLALVGGFLTERRPDLRTLHFSHTPFVGPEGMRVLPDDVSVELLEGMASYRACGFHSRRWAAAFEQSCSEIIGRVPRSFVAPLGIERSHLNDVASSAETLRAAGKLNEVIGDRSLILRVDRMELSKNLLRGFLAFDDL
ncbi:MAG: trehalose-6-phosphate synthase, partial [Acidimicrobiales bacterium]